MSESTFTLQAQFPDGDTARAAANHLERAKLAMNEAMAEGQELFLHQYLAAEESTYGVEFDSWWLLDAIRVQGEGLKLACLGSPGDDLRADLAQWLTASGATHVAGELTLAHGSGTFDLQGGVMVQRFDENEEAAEDLTEVDGVGHTLLHLAAEAGDERRVRSLIARGADVNAPNHGGRTPVCMAVNDDIEPEQAIACIEALVAAGADVNVEAKTTGTALAWALAQDYQEIAERLRALGATIRYDRGKSR